jgi:hypothetical protein
VFHHGIVKNGTTNIKNDVSFLVAGFSYDRFTKSGYNIVNQYYKEAVRGLNSVILADGDIWYSHIYHLPGHPQAAYTIDILHQQVFNGGLHQYFINGYGQFAYLTVDNLKLIKAFSLADILERALDKVNEEQYSIDEFRRKILSKRLSHLLDHNDELESFLDELDNEYYESGENLAALYLASFENVNS